MAFYLVSAVPKHDRLDDLGARLARDEFVSLRPFGRALSTSLRGARLRGMALPSGRRRTIASRRSRKSAPRCSMTIFTISASSRWRKARAEIESKTCPSCSPTPDHIDPT
jgi:hypothetical protein